MSTEIANGRYTAKVVCWGFTKTEKGSDQFAIEFDIDVHGSEYAPTRHTHFIGLQSDKGLEILDKHLAACGWKGDDYGSIELDTNTPVSLKIENDDYGPKVKFVDPVGGGGGLVERKRMNENDQRAVVAKLNARRKSQPASARPATSGGQPPKPTAPAASAAPRPAAPTKPQAPRAAAPKQAAPPKEDTNSDWGFEGSGDQDGGSSIPF